MQRDPSRQIPRQRVRGSARAVRAVRNTRVFQTETRVVADVPGALLCNRKREILRQRVRGSIRAIRAGRNTRVFQTETRVVADVLKDSKGL
jgi:hypothetical protein